jgi:hypothetical protein
MALAVFQSVHAELLRVFVLVGPQQLDVASCAVVLLGIPEPENIIDIKVKPLKFLGLVLALVGHELPLNGFAELLFGLGPGLRTLLRWDR